MPEIHHTEHIEDDHQDAQNDQERSVKIETKQQAGDKKHRSKWQGQIHNQVVPDC